MPIAGVRPMKLLMREVSPIGGGVAGCDGDELNILTLVCSFVKSLCVDAQDTDRTQCY